MPAQSILLPEMQSDTLNWLSIVPKTTLKTQQD